MNKNRFAVFLASAALTVGAAGCSTTNESNSNARNANSNTAVVTNNNGNANTSGVNTLNANSGTTGTTNANISRADYDRDRARYDREGGTGRFSGTIGQGAEDGWIHFKVRTALAAADNIRDSTINVDVNNGVVTLRGTVADNAQRARAEAAARVDGVSTVRNQLTIRGEGGGSGSGNSNNSNRS
jgi:osmotically-inducible protein OsmY